MARRTLYVNVSQDEWFELERIAEEEEIPGASSPHDLGKIAVQEFLNQFE